MRKNVMYWGLVWAGIFIPVFAEAQIAEELKGLHGVLDTLYKDMMPECEKLIAVSRGLGGFAALFYIAARVWRHLANAEPIDFYPLFRPFVLGFCILNFPLVIGVFNGLLKLVETETAKMAEDSNKSVQVLLERKEAAMRQTKKWQIYVGESGKGDRVEWYKYTYDTETVDEWWGAEIGNDIKFAAEKFQYNTQNSIKSWLNAILEVLYQAAALCINTLRTFQLVVFSILGPLVFALSIFDGLHHTLTGWISRYLNVFLWLPVANIFGSILGKIQQKMIEIDIQQIDSTGNTFFSAYDIAYIIFMIIGILGYFTVPSVANYIVQAGGAGAALNQKVAGAISTAAGTAGNIAAGGTGIIRDAVRGMGK